MPTQTTPVFTPVTESGIAGMAIPAADEIHVWAIPVTADLQPGLSQAEESRAARFHRTEDADRYRSARWALRRLCGAYLHVSPSAIEFGGEPQQKPLLVTETPRPLHFNLSHSGRLVLIAFGGRPVGVDVEWTDRNFDPDNLMEEHFSEKEQAAIAAAPDRLLAFYQLWTRKEALLKGIGAGLQDSLREWPVLNGTVDGFPGERWQLLSFSAGPQYAAALACNVSQPGIVFYRAL